MYEKQRVENRYCARCLRTTRHVVEAREGALVCDACGSKKFPLRPFVPTMLPVERTAAFAAMRTGVA